MSTKSEMVEQTNLAFDFIQKLYLILLETVSPSIVGL